MPRALGNQGMIRAHQQTLQAKLKVGSVNDAYEQQADQAAERVMSMSSHRDISQNVQAGSTDSVIQRQARGMVCTEEKNHTVLRNPSHHSNTAVNSCSADFPQGGYPLSTAEKDFYEPRFSRDFNQVRIHTGSAAAKAAQSINAKAFTLGQNIVFDQGQHNQSRDGRRLMAHELAHTLQQASHQTGAHEGVLQRKESSPDKTQDTGGISVTDVFPFPQGSKLVLARIMDDRIFAIISASDDPEQKKLATALKAIHGVRVTVTTATPDDFVAIANSVVRVPAQDEIPEKKLTDLTLRFHRSGTDFTFSMMAKEGKSTTLTAIMPTQKGLTAKKDKDGTIILSSTENDKTVPQLRVTQEKKSIMIEAFTESISPMISKIMPEVKTISVNKLDDAKKEEDIQKAADKIMQQQASLSRTRSQQVNFGLGGTKVDDTVALLARTSWIIRFPSTGIAALFTDNKQLATGVGQVVNIPLEAQILYTPPSSLLGGVSSGVGLRLPISVPVNISILGGISGGSMLFPVAENKQRRNVFGPAFGVALGVELGRWRVNLRADHLFNLIEGAQGNAADISTFSGNIGVGF
ncbi:MAG: DUF4157 domain-containing protein [Methyloprofundus sp.]|nr:DUF4157 domain-containing protein [Methyloprofundus sp.]